MYILYRNLISVEMALRKVKYALLPVCRGNSLYIDVTREAFL